MRPHISRLAQSAARGEVTRHICQRVNDSKHDPQQSQLHQHSTGVNFINFLRAAFFYYESVIHNFLCTKYIFGEVLFAAFYVLSIYLATEIGKKAGHNAS